jgi:hypothetical protein
MIKDRILPAYEKLIIATKEELLSEEYLINLIRQWGIHDDDVINFGDINNPYRSDIGMLQQPEQLSPALIYLSTLDIKKYLEIGTFIGSTCSFIGLYLSRFNPEVSVTAVDRDRDFNPDLFSLCNKHFNLDYIKGTSDDIEEQMFDLCFLDADHKYNSVKKDFNNVKKYTKYLMLHDIIDEGTVKERDDSGTIKFWNEIKNKNCKEFTAHPENLKVMGIGIKKL